MIIGNERGVFHMLHGETVWEFNTAKFRITLEILPEDMDPADSFEFDEDIEAVRNDDVEWFSAKVAVYFKGVEIASDHLGGCAYNSIEEFYTSHRDANPLNRNCQAFRAVHGENSVIGHYFPDMVRQAIGEARKVAAELETSIGG